MNPAAVARRPWPALTGTARRDLLLCAAGAVLLLAWDASGLDMAVQQAWGDGSGFRWKSAWLTSTVIHQGGRGLAWAVFGLLVLDAWRGWLAGPPVALRRRWLAVTLACLTLVPGLKRISTTSCPWDLEAFGGTARHVSHWAFAVQDGGPGHCFPSGHAVAAFAFFTLYFLWRGTRPRLARACLAGVLAVGAVFGAAQTVRGAHFVSHTLWSAWLCWALCVAASLWLDRPAPQAIATAGRGAPPLA